MHVLSFGTRNARTARHGTARLVHSIVRTSGIEYAQMRTVFSVQMHAYSGKLQSDEAKYTQQMKPDF